MRDLNRGAKDHLRPIFLAMKPRGPSASCVFEQLVIAITVPVSRSSSSAGGTDEMDS